MIDWFNCSGGEGMEYKSANGNQNLVEIMFFCQACYVYETKLSKKEFSVEKQTRLN